MKGDGVMKHTKHKLLSSIATLFVCLAMFIGSTYAWFTDSASTGVNKIQAGNLDIEVSYKKDGTNWTSIQDETSLFSNNLWEPGHTEFVTLKVENKGTLALKYKMMVTPVSENGGINVDNENFKLSDYLVFGTTDSVASDPNYANRELARAAIEETRGLTDVNALTKTYEMAKGAAPQYITLVVYMPETVNNKANAKPGTAAPSIDLGIKVVATQVENESDSFGPNYDAGAVNGSEYVVGPTYNYFPQIMKTESVNPNGYTTITATGKLNVTDISETTLATVTVPSAAVADGTTKLTVTVKPQAPTNPSAQTAIQAEIDAGRETANFEIKVSGIKPNNQSGISVEIYVGKGLSNVKAFHNGTVITEAIYDSLTGMLSFTTTSFSDYTVSYDPAVAAIGTTVYGTVQDAILAAPTNAGNTTTVITLLRDVKNGASFGFPDDTRDAGRNITIDFAGCSYEFLTPGMGSTGTETQAMHLINGNKLTLKNGTIKVSKNSTDIKRMIQNYCDLTIENMDVDCSTVKDSYNNSFCRGTVTVKGNTKLIASSATAKIFDVDGAYCDQHNCDVEVVFDETYTGTTSGVIEYVSSNSHTSKLTIKGGTFNGNITSTGNGKPVIKGGVYSFNPESFVLSGYEVKEDGGKYVVSLNSGAKTEPSTVFPDDAEVINDQDTLEERLKSAEEKVINTLYIGEGEFNINNVDCDGKTIVFVGSGYGNTTLKYGTTPGSNGGEQGACYSFERANVTFKDVTLQDVNGDDVDYKGFVRSKSLAFENCLLKSRMTYLGENGTVSFKNCTFNTPKYAAWIYSSQTYNFENCLFESSKGRFLNIYSEYNINPIINAIACKFIDTSDGTDSNAVFNIKTKAKTTLTIKDYVVKGASPLYKVESDNGTIVKVDGKTVYGIAN